VVPENASKVTTHRIKHKANRPKSMNRWANAIVEAKLVLDRLVIVPDTEPVCQPGLSYKVFGHFEDSEEISVHSSEGQQLHEDSAPRTPSTERQVTPPPPEAEADIEG
jgi:hypothetical protein